MKTLSLHIILSLCEIILSQHITHQTVSVLNQNEVFNGCRKTIPKCSHDANMEFSADCFFVTKITSMVQHSIYWRQILACSLLRNNINLSDTKRRGRKKTWCLALPHLNFILKIGCVCWDCLRDLRWIIKIGREFLFSNELLNAKSRWKFLLIISNHCIHISDFKFPFIESEL